MADDALLVRFRDRDSKEGITRDTMKKIADALDLSETAAVHRALAEFAQRYVAQYPRDDAPLTAGERQRIAEIVEREHGRAVVTETLFDEPAASSPHVKRVGKRVSPSRAR
jgi:ABC-type protease/lipase transport system fused ATPase/permease subunit